MGGKYLISYLCTWQPHIVVVDLVAIFFPPRDNVLKKTIQGYFFMHGCFDSKVNGLYFHPQRLRGAYQAIRWTGAK